MEARVSSSFDAVYARLDNFIFWLAQGFELPLFAGVPTT